MVRIGRIGARAGDRGRARGGPFSPAMAAGYKTVIQFGVNRAATTSIRSPKTHNPNIWAFMQIYPSS